MKKVLLASSLSQIDDLIMNGMNTVNFLQGIKTSEEMMHSIAENNTDVIVIFEILDDINIKDILIEVIRKYPNLILIFMSRSDKPEDKPWLNNLPIKHIFWGKFNIPQLEEVILR